LLHPLRHVPTGTSLHKERATKKKKRRRRRRRRRRRGERVATKRRRMRGEKEWDEYEEGEGTQGR